MKLLYKLIALTLPFLLLANIVLATTDTIGDTSSTDYGSSDYVWFFKITSSAAGNLTTIGININNNAETHFRVAIYSGNSSFPNNLLAQSSDFAAVNGWNDKLLDTLVSINSGTIYWLAYQASDNAASNTIFIHFGVGSRVNQAQAYGTFPASFTSGSSDSHEANMRMNYEITNQAPQIFIYEPENITYNTNTIPINITIYDDNSATFWVKILFNDYLIYNDTNYVNNSNFNDYSPFNNGIYNLTIWANDINNIINISTVIFTVNATILNIPASYGYFCSGNQSVENHTLNNGTSIMTGLQCSFGCDNANGINYVQGRSPQGDLCSSDPFFNLLELIGIIVTLIIGGIIILKKVKL